jgi:hypothetical protein
VIVHHQMICSLCTHKRKLNYCDCKVLIQYSTVQHITIQTDIAMLVDTFEDTKWVNRRTENTKCTVAKKKKDKKTNNGQHSNTQKTKD